ncbi:MAG: RIO1 family regulatory kinase/ATPase, partial [Anaerolineaceae bacterium]
MTIEPYDDDYEDQNNRAIHVRKIPSERSLNKAKKPGKSTQRQENHTASEELPQFSYHASRHEASWLYESLGDFLENQWIADVLSMIKGGKEAAVYRCVPDPHMHVEALAAKVYRPRLFRSLKNDHVYRQGRSNLDSNGHLIKDDGMLHAIAKKTEYGRELMHSSWIEYEYQNMLLLKAAGADVPQVYARGKNAMLMDFIGYAGQPAPLLNDVQLERNEANLLFERVLRNIQIMLENNRVHADLSAYNILYCDAGITLIDFPQTIDPRENHNAAWIFARDVRR